MPLIALWESNSAVVDQFSIEQVVRQRGTGSSRTGPYAQPSFEVS